MVKPRLTSGLAARTPCQACRQRLIDGVTVVFPVLPRSGQPACPLKVKPQQCGAPAAGSSVECAQPERLPPAVSLASMPSVMEDRIRATGATP